VGEREGKMTKRAAVYARYSSEEQTGGESIEYQLEQSKDHITKQGWSLGEVFVDRAKSGTTTYRREEFNRMVALAKTKDRPFDVVVAWSTSRFGRNQDEAIFNKIGLRRQGVDVRFVSQPVPDGHIGTLIERIYEWKDEFDSIQIGEYAFQGQKQVTQKGFHGGGKAPYGYSRVRVPDPDGKQDKDGKVVEYVSYEVVEGQAVVVRRVFEMRANGRSYREVAHTLNEEGSVSPGGSTWDVSSVRTILLNETYLGRRVWNQTRRNKRVQRGTKVPNPREEWIVTENAHEAIIDKALWDAVQERRGRIRLSIEMGKGAYNTAHSAYLLTGLLKCEECGANFTMTGPKNKNGGTRYYRCSYHANRGTTVCSNNRRVRQDAIEEAVMQTFSGILLKPATVRSMVEDARDQLGQRNSVDRIGEINARIQRVQKEIENLTAGIRSLGPLDTLKDAMRKCQKGLAALEVEKHEVSADEMLDWTSIDEALIKVALIDLKALVADASSAKEALQENIREIRIPKKGAALLEPRPEGLLNRVFLLVTPRGVA
jgi:site-specific DNA recombinase